MSFVVGSNRQIDSKMNSNKMLFYKLGYLLKRGLPLCALIAVFVYLLPSSYISKGSGESFGVSHSRISTLDLNRFEHRLKQLRTRCEAGNQTEIAKSYAKTLLHSRILTIIYCPVPQTTSTQLKHALLKIEGKSLHLQTLYNISTRQAIHSQAQDLNLKHSTLLQPGKLAGGANQIILVSRDPWQRLAAAYQDMVIGGRLHNRLCSHFDHLLTRELTFNGFLSCLLHYSNGSQSLNKMDTKLSPVHTICAACRVPYNVIGRSYTIH